MASLETWIGLRYLRAKKRSGFMSFISVVSIIGIALGVTVLILVLSVVNGFQKDIRNQLLNIAPHAEAFYFNPPSDASWQNLQKELEGKKGVLATAPFIANQALLAGGGEMHGAQLRGILPDMEKNVIDYADRFLSGTLNDLQADEFNIILGSSLAESLGIELGGKVTVITPEGNVTPAGMVPRLKQFNVVGLVQTGVDEADKSMALIHLDDAAKLYRIDESFIPLRLRLDDPQNAPLIMQNLLDDKQQQSIQTLNWTDYNRTYFNAVEMEKRMLTLLLSCIIAVAVFNLVSSLMMAVNEKQSDIAILRTLGLSPRSIMKIFVVQGMVSGFWGTLAGLIFGLLLAWKIGAIVAFIEQISGSKLVSSDVYFLSYLPSDIQFNDVVSVVIISLLLSLIATIYPSYRAARTQPAEALRYE